MKHADYIDSELPGLRRYARAATGCQETGDAIVKEALKPFEADDAPSSLERLDLFRSIEQVLARSGNSGPFEGVAPLPSRAQLLTSIAGLSASDAASLSGMTESEIRNLLETSRSGDASSDPADIFIIEDEPMIAAHLAEIAREMGHNVIGTTGIASDAIRACRERRPDLLLSDVMLGDERRGADAAHDIASMYGIPVIFITAFPQSLLRGEKGEPAYLIEKPFRADSVRVMISRALGKSRSRPGA
ncbi:response regulator [Henriciella mobilis]|uniref:response regulator n=1 Tax=Henriciella mobilis TaxID=2305467 RepID=UPI0013140624|nr:response regulator [Henriciella mobilis]